MHKEVQKLHRKKKDGTLSVRHTGEHTVYPPVGNVAYADAENNGESTLSDIGVCGGVSLHTSLHAH